MKRILSLLLLTAMLASSLLISGCKKEEKAAGSLTITSDYVITLPENATDAEMAAAKKLQTALSEFCSLNLAISNDFFAEESQIPKYEIVIGNCNRSDIKTAQTKAGTLGYTVFASNGKIYIYGSDDTFLGYAIDALISEYISAKTSFTVPDTLDMTYQHVFKQTNLTINGVDISQYKIVYGNDGYLKTGRQNGKWVESGRYVDVANALSNEIYMLTGKTLPVLEAAKTEESDYEIIVGWANRNSTNNFFRNNKQTFEDYSYGLVGNQLIFAGGSSNACYYAGVAFTQYCSNMQGSDFKSEMTKGAVDLIKIVCIGDSITDGAGKLDDGTANDSNIHSYPVYLQKLLGFRYYVANYGHGGQRMTSFATESPNYVPSYLAKPDVLIMMFGTNDANKGKYTPDWGTDTARTRYENAASAMIAQYKSVNPNLQVFLMTPPAILPNSTHKQYCSLAAQYNREFAQANGLNLVDIWNVSEEEQWVFNDGIHPQGEVYKRLAEVVYQNIKDVIIK